MYKRQVDLSDNGLIYLTAEEEEEKVIAQGNAPLNDEMCIRDRLSSWLRFSGGCFGW